MKKTIVLLSIMAGSLVVASAFAYQGNVVGMMNSQQSGAVQTAIVNKDYTTRANLMSGTKMAEIINTQDKFLKFVEMYGYLQSAKQLGKELGLQKTGMDIGGTGMQRGMPGDRGRGRFGSGTIKFTGDAGFQAEQKTITDKDYAAWASLMSGTKMAEIINTQDKFSQFVDMHAAMGSGDITTATSIAKKLGIQEMRMGRGPGEHKQNFSGSTQTFKTKSNKRK